MTKTTALQFPMQWNDERGFAVGVLEATVTAALAGWLSPNRSLTQGSAASDGRFRW